MKAVRTSDGVITRKSARKRTEVIKNGPNESNPLNRVTRNARDEQLKGMHEDWTHYVVCLLVFLACTTENARKDKCLMVSMGRGPRVHPSSQNPHTVKFSQMLAHQLKCKIEFECTFIDRVRGKHVLHPSENNRGEVRFKE